MDDTGRLDDASVVQRLARIDELLERLEKAPGPTSRSAVETVRALTEVYGEALARVMDHADAPLADRMAGDELLGHLLVLHSIHPEPVERRVARAVERLKTDLRGRGAEIELAGIDAGVARVRLRTKGCGSSAAGVTEAVREALLAVAPELRSVEALPGSERQAAAFVPLDALTRRGTQPQATP